MKAGKALVVALALALLGCDYPPSYGYVEPPVAPARRVATHMEVAQGTAVPVVIVAHDKSRFDGASAATSARTKDESVAIITPSTREGTIQHGAADITGTIFVVYGVAPGETEIEVFLDGDDKGTLLLTVVPR